MTCTFFSIVLMNIDLFSDRTMNTLCYKLDSSWIYTTWNEFPSNILCENQCKRNPANYQYYGTSVSFF